LKIFICEFITGGGLYRELLPPSLLVEGAMMRDAALRDFAQIRDIEILMTCDQRLAAPAEAHEVLMVDTQQDVWALWERCISASDAILLIAPETGGVLERLTQLADRLNKMVFGSKASAIKLAGDKWLTYQSFISHNIPTPDTYLANDLPNSMQGPYISKSRDGAGCNDMAYFDDIQLLQAWLKGREHTHIIQPFQTGDAASFSMLCKNGKAYLLSCNRQHIQIDGQEFSYHGGVVNGMDAHRETFNTLAQKIAQALPGLAGYVGVDLIVHKGEYFVLEINPRLTTSYVALRQACGGNPAQMLLDLFYNETFIMPAIIHHKVEVSLNAAVLTD
jgi:predicted ATP-grasp superfamily ATP-dependent carboligase